jgi:hypothetical protein
MFNGRFTLSALILCLLSSSMLFCAKIKKVEKTINSLEELTMFNQVLKRKKTTVTHLNITLNNTLVDYGHSKMISSILEKLESNLVSLKIIVCKMSSNGFKREAINPILDTLKNLIRLKSFSLSIEGYNPGFLPIPCIFKIIGNLKNLKYLSIDCDIYSYKDSNVLAESLTKLKNLENLCILLFLRFLQDKNKTIHNIFDAMQTLKLLTKVCFENF